jgi:hypothetical protein
MHKLVRKAARVELNKCGIDLNLNFPCFVWPFSHAGTSELWGTNGEKFKPSGRLLDWSYAGESCFFLFLRQQELIAIFEIARC